jgi:hypothetical protein
MTRIIHHSKRGRDPLYDEVDDGLDNFEGWDFDERGRMIKLPDSVRSQKGGGQGQSWWDKNATSGNSWHSSGGGKVYKSCTHTGDKVVFEVTHKDGTKKQLFASSGTGLNEYSGKWGLIIDLASNLRSPNEISFIKPGTSPKFDALKKYELKYKSVPSEVLKLDWADMSTPKCGLDFWIKLWDLMPEKTVIACMGGHGRTGTCLGALIIATGVDYYSAVETVRNEHCDKAIETTSQEVYLHELYMEVIKRRIKLIEGKKEFEKELVDLDEDLAYALKHPPKGGRKGNGFTG